jgi:hypothetical protein
MHISTYTLNDIVKKQIANLLDVYLQLLAFANAQPD